MTNTVFFKIILSYFILFTQTLYTIPCPGMCHPKSKIFPTNVSTQALEHLDQVGFGMVRILEQKFRSFKEWWQRVHMGP